MRLEGLPAALLREIAFALGRSAFVVALSSRDLEAARRACRDGVDDSERDRFPGIALTVREAEERLRNQFGLGNDTLTTREAAGSYLVTSLNTNNFELFTNDNEVFSSFFETGLFSTLLAYGADPDVEDGDGSSLHMLYAYESPNALEMARQLLASGADVNMRCPGFNAAGRSPLAWIVSLSMGDIDGLQTRQYAFQLGSLLIDHGADVVQSARDYSADSGLRRDTGDTLLGHLDEQDWEDDATAAAANKLRAQMQDALGRAIGV